MAELVPTDDLPSGLVPESDLPDTGRKTPKQMKDMLPPLVSGRLGIHGKREPRVDPGTPLDILDRGTYETGGEVTDVLAKNRFTRPIAPAAGYVSNIALSALPSMFPGGGATKAVALKDIEKMGTLAAAQRIGLDVPPSLKGAGAVEKGIESIGGKADLARARSELNREAIQIASRREAGVPANLPLNTETLAAARIPFYKPYEEISQISPRAKEALTRLRQAREDAKGYWQEFSRQGTMASKKEAQRLDQQADLYEQLIDREAVKAGRPDLLPALQQARVALAKNHDVERAMIPGSGEIDAKALGRTLKKRGEGGMTGDLGTIGKFAQNFPDFVQPKATATDVSALRPYASLLGLSLGAGAGGEYLGKEHLGSNYGFVMAALPFLSPAARRLALSKAMQSGALAPGASAGRAAAGSLIPLNRIGRDDD